MSESRDTLIDLIKLVVVCILIVFVVWPAIENAAFPEQTESVELPPTNSSELGINFDEVDLRWSLVFAVIVAILIIIAFILWVRRSV